MAVNKTGYIVGGVAGAAIAVAAMAGAGGHLPFANAEPAITPAVSPGPASGAANRLPPGAPMSFADIFARVSPAVVSINVTSRRPVTDGLPFGIDPDGDGQGQGPGAGPQGPVRPGPNGQPRGPWQLSSGSGFFIS